MTRPAPNEYLAVALTLWFGSIWTFYLFCLFGLLPLFPPMAPYRDGLLYWSNTIQLIALPLIMVGTNILGRSSEARAKSDHERLLQCYEEQLVIHAELAELLAQRHAEIVGLIDKNTPGF